MKHFFKRLFGYKFLLNLKTMEIHSLKNEHPNCRLSLMSKHNKKYITTKEKDALLKFTTHDGCRWCMKEQDNG